MKSLGLGYPQVWTAPIEAGWHDTCIYIFKYIHVNVHMQTHREFRVGYVRFGGEIGQDVYWMND